MEGKTSSARERWRRRFFNRTRSRHHQQPVYLLWYLEWYLRTASKIKEMEKWYMNEWKERREKKERLMNAFWYPIQHLIDPSLMFSFLFPFELAKFYFCFWVFDWLNFKLFCWWKRADDRMIRGLPNKYWHSNFLPPTKKIKVKSKLLSSCVL